MFPIIHVCLLRKKIVGDYAGMFRKQMRTVFEAFLWRGQKIERGRFHIKIASYYGHENEVYNNVMDELMCKPLIIQ